MDFKRVCLCFIIIFFVIIIPLKADAFTGLESLNEAENLTKYLQIIDQELQKYESGLSLAELWRQLISGEKNFDIDLIKSFLSAVFFTEAAASAGLLGRLIFLSVLSLLLTELTSSFSKAQVTVVARAVIFLALITQAVASFSICAAACRNAIDLISGFFYAALPLLTVLLAATGGGAAAAVLHPALLFTVGIFLHILSYVVFPLLYFSALLLPVSCLVPEFSLKKAAEFCKSLAMGLLKVGTTVFLAVLSMLGLGSAAASGLAVKAAKTAGGIFIPIVGKPLADAADSVLASALLIKNSLGMLSVAAILLLCAVPALKILIQALLFRLAGVLVEPLGDKQLAEALYGLGSSLMLFFAVLAISGLLFYFLLVIMIFAGNAAVMFR